MKRIQLLENGFVFNGKVVPWVVVDELLLLVVDEKTRARIRKKLSDKLKFETVNPEKDFETMARCLGVKPGANLTGRIYKKMDKLNQEITFLYGEQK